MKAKILMVMTASFLLSYEALQAQEIPKNVKPFVRLVSEALYVEEYQEGQLLKSYVTHEANVCGSGTIISRDGLILTNYHVARPSGVHTTDDGVTVAYRTATNTMKVYELSENDPLRKPRLRYIASYLGGDKTLDMAILKVVADANTGRQIDRPAFDYVALGNPYETPVNRELTILGYPGKGGMTLNITSGPYNGTYVSEDNAKDPLNGRIKTVAPIAQGNSGGSALYQQKLIGVPTMVSSPDQAGASFSYLNPVTWAVCPLVVAKVKFGEATPEIDPRWVASPYNYKEQTKTNLYVAGKVKATQSRQPVPEASVTLYRADRTEDEINKLADEIKAVTVVLWIKRARASGMSVQAIAESLQTEEESVNTIAEIKWDDLSDDTQRYLQGEFFFASCVTDEAGFYILSVPRNRKLAFDVQCDGFHTVTKRYTTGSGLYENAGSTNLIRY